jgi:integrase
MMKRLVHILKWAVAAGMLPVENNTTVKCLAPLKRGHTTAQEVEPVRPVATEVVDATLRHLTQVVADMVRFQLLTGARPGEVCRITPAMVDASGEVWTITLREHKNSHHGRARTIYVGPQARQVLAPYLLRDPSEPCFSPIESEQQRRQAAHERRVKEDRTTYSCAAISQTITLWPVCTRWDHVRFHVAEKQGVGMLGI